LATCDAASNRGMSMKSWNNYPRTPTVQESWSQRC
jgi:hypothetical protein